MLFLAPSIWDDMMTLVISLLLSVSFFGQIDPVGVDARELDERVQQSRTYLEGWDLVSARGALEGLIHLSADSTFSEKSRLAALQLYSELEYREGNVSQAVATAREALNLLEQTDLVDGVDHVSLLAHLAKLQTAVGTNELLVEARATTETALSIMGDIQKPPSDYAAIRVNLYSTLARVHIGLRNFSGAIQVLEQEMDVAKGTSAYPFVLNDLGVAYLFEGKLALAQEKLEAAYNAFPLGARADAVRSGIVANNFLVAVLQKEPYAMEKLARDLALGERKLLLQQFTKLPEAQMRQQFYVRGSCASLIYSALISNKEPSKLAKEGGAEAALALKGVLLDCFAARQAKAARRDQIMAVPEKGYLHNVTRGLGEKDVLCEFVKYWHHDLEGLIHNESVGHFRYICFVISRTGVSVLDLGAAEELDSLIRDYRGKIAPQPRIFSPNIREERQGAAFAWSIFLKTLRRVQDEVGIDFSTTERLFLSPDGDLQLFPFEASVVSEPDSTLGAPLPNYLVQAYPEMTVSYINAGRDLLVFKLGEASSFVQDNSVLIGVPEFDMSATSMGDAVTFVGEVVPGESYEDSESTLAALQSKLDDSGRWDSPWEYLTDSEPGFDAISAKLKPGEIYKGWQALEEVVERMPPPRVLTLVTHGAYLKEQGDRFYSGAGQFQLLDTSTPTNSTNPMLRSFLLMAGANNPREMRAHSLQDGILTAAELAALDLSETQLVALVACQTGEGVVDHDVGVSGLRRAILQSGADAMLASLWEIPAEDSPEMYSDFLHRWRELGQPKAEALQGAKLSQLQRRNKDTHPYYWAGVILLGSPN